MHTVQPQAIIASGLLEQADRTAAGFLRARSPRAAFPPILTGAAARRAVLHELRSAREPGNWQAHRSLSRAADGLDDLRHHVLAMWLRRKAWPAFSASIEAEWAMRERERREHQRDQYIAESTHRAAAESNGAE